MRSRLILAAALGLALCSLWWAASPVARRVLATEPSAAPVADALPEPVDLAPVLDFAPFGQAEGMQADLAPDSAALVLLGITMALPPERSRAMIAGGTEPVANYGAGDPVAPGLTVVEVFADHVVVDSGGAEAVLSFAAGEALLTRAPEAAQALAPPKLSPGTSPNPEVPKPEVPDPEAANPDTDSDTAADTSPDTAAPAMAPAEAPAMALVRLRAEAQQDPSALAARLGLQPGPDGYRVTDAVAPTLTQAGLKPGDLLTLANGTALGNPHRDAALFDQAAALGRVSLSVLRDGQTLLMTFPLP